MNDKEALRMMIHCLEIFEGLQTVVSEEVWARLDEYLRQREHVTWNDIGDFRECLKSFLEATVEGR